MLLFFPFIFSNSFNHEICNWVCWKICGKCRCTF